MWIDLDCPVELQRWERVGELTRGQIYLHCLNLTQTRLSGLRVRVTPLTERGEPAAEPQCYDFEREIEARGSFVLQFPVDGMPGFAELDVMPERVDYAEGGQWLGEEGNRVDASYEPPAIGPERVALVALAGKDAVCFPERSQDQWRCVCGRLNRPETDSCARCGRAQAVVFEEFVAEGIEARYQALYEMRVEREHSLRIQERERVRKAQAQQRRAERIRRRRLATSAVLIVAAMLLFAFLRKLL